MTKEASDRYTDTHTHVISQLSKGLGEHGITILSPKGKRSPRQIWVKYCNLMLLLYFWRERLQYCLKMTKEASDRYTDTHTHVIKKRAGRRPALKRTRGAWDYNTVTKRQQQPPDRYG